MLLSLSINNFTLVEQLEIDFHSGTTAITGETGAGKSLILDALGLTLGDRADASLIRHGAERLEVAACFDIGNIPQACHWLDDQGFEAPQQECLIRRSVTREGRSRGFINGSPATMQQLQALGSLLADIHSQHEHQSLLRKDTHRALLDDFAGNHSLCASVQKSFQAWRFASDKLHTLSTQTAELEAARELLSFQVEELNQLNLAEQELEQLEAEHHLLANAETILHDSYQLLELCQGEGEFSLQRALGQALHLLHKMPSKPEALLTAENMLVSANIEITEASREIQRHIDGFDANPERLQQLDERLTTIYDLARKHRVPATELFATHRLLQTKLEQLLGGAQNIDQLRQETAKLADAYEQHARALSQARSRAAKEFAEAVNQQLTRLNMKDAALAVVLNPNPEQKYSATGMESVEFLITTNLGQPPGPLAKIASGGELSRISLAIQVIAARHSAIPTLLFDEVDVGIGGATADVVGQLLKELGERGQVICITHQPQVASRSHHHLLARKQTTKNGVESSLEPLAVQQRIKEIARMLGGARITEKTLAHATEMLEMNAAD